MGSEQYPKRPKFFSHRFCRVLAKACAANEIGPEACWLLTVIAHTEDAKGYRDAVTFFNGQLQAFVGCGSEDSLNRMRSKAVRAGWLHYESGGKGKAGRYWVLVPDQHRDWDDLPSDESFDCNANSPAPVRVEPGGKCGENPGESAGEPVFTRTGAGESRGKVRGEPREKPGESAGHSSLYPSLTLTQDPPTPRGAGGGECDPPEPTPRGPSPAEVEEHWNAQPALTPVRSSDPNRDRAIRSRQMDPQWCANWRAVISYLGSAPKYTSGKLDFRPTLSWLFERSNFAKALDEMCAPPRIAPGTGPPEDSESVKAFRAMVEAEKQAKRTG